MRPKHLGDFKPKPTLYTLPHGIEVIGEYPPRGVNRYWRVRIRPHHFFKGKVVSRGVYTTRNRAVMSSVLGRALLPTEHVHHKNEDRGDDDPGNLEVLTAAEHNRHHKTGARHSDATKKKIGASLKVAFSDGRRTPPLKGFFEGQKHSDEAKRKMSETRKKMIAEGIIEKPTPPSAKGRKASIEARQKQSEYASGRDRNEDGRFVL